jgi:hypothetical protein
LLRGSGFNRLVPDSIELDRNNEDCQVISSVISDAPAAVDNANLDSASGLGKKKKKNRRKKEKRRKEIVLNTLSPKFMNPHILKICWIS